MTHLDLFSGIGGFALAAQWNGIETIGFSEIEPYACKILKRHWPDVPNFGDIRNVTRQAVADANERFSLAKKDKIQTGRHAANNGGMPSESTVSVCDLITGGFPCQPFSVAGERRGAQDDRHLWPEMCRVIAETRPTWVLGENVPGIINMELDRVLSDLENLGYACWPVVVPACAVDARHRRDRVWIVAHAKGQLINWSKRHSNKTGRDGFAVGGEDVGHADERGIRRGRSSRDSGHALQPSRWPTEPAVGRVAQGIPNRSHRLKGLGNAIVPQVAAHFLRWINNNHRELASSRGP